MTFTAALLAGGLSRRMGADKATLVIRGQPLWAMQIALLRELEPAALWISARERPPWCPADIECVEDEPPSRGPLSGISASLNRLQTSHLLVLAVDLPGMTAEQLRRLCARAGNDRGVMPVNGEHLEPLCAIYPIEAAAAAKTALAGTDFSMQRLARFLVKEKYAVPWQITAAERAFFHNVNTPADLPSCQQFQAKPEA